MINERMKEARAESGLSQAELARRVGVSRQTINMIENGESEKLREKMRASTARRALFDKPTVK